KRSSVARVSERENDVSHSQGFRCKCLGCNRAKADTLQMKHDLHASDDDDDDDSTQLAGQIIQSVTKHTFKFQISITWCKVFPKMISTERWTRTVLLTN